MTILATATPALAGTDRYSLVVASDGDQVRAAQRLRYRVFADLKRHRGEFPRATWTRVQTIEAQGGIVAALHTGDPQARVAATAQARFDAVATGRTPLVGISVFAPKADRTRATTAPEPVTFDPSTWVEKVDPLVPLALAEAYERGGGA